ncbi:hypothetical protein [uncultured Helicobacter sp.]
MLESKTTNDIMESKQSQGLDSSSVCARNGASGSVANVGAIYYKTPIQQP